MPVFDVFKHGDMGRWVKQQMEERLTPDVLEGTGFECGRPWMEVAESAYRAYAAATGNLYQGNQMPAWGNLPLRTQWAWEAAIRQVAAFLVLDRKMDESTWEMWRPRYRIFVLAGNMGQFDNWRKENGLGQFDAVYVSDANKIAGCHLGSTIYKIGNWYKRSDLAEIDSLIEMNHMTVIEQTAAR